MKRLTEWIQVGGMERPEVMHHGHRYGRTFFQSQTAYENYIELIEHLAAYEDTGLNPQEIEALKNKSTPIKPVVNIYYYFCSVCGERRSIRQKHDYCHNCGQRFDWSQT